MRPDTLRARLDNAALAAPWVAATSALRRCRPTEHRPVRNAFGVPRVSAGTFAADDVIQRRDAKRHRRRRWWRAPSLSPVSCDDGAVSRKLMALAGVALIVAGLLALAYQQISYTTRETVIDVVNVAATTETKKTIPLSPIVGIAAVGSGVVIVVMSRKV